MATGSNVLKYQAPRKNSKLKGQALANEQADIFNMPQNLKHASLENNVYTVLPDGRVHTWLGITHEPFDVDRFIASRIGITLEEFKASPEKMQARERNNVTLPKDMKPETLEVSALNPDAYLEFGGAYQYEPAYVHVGTDRTPVKQFAAIHNAVTAILNKTSEPTSSNVSIMRILDSFGFLQAVPQTQKDSNDGNKIKVMAYAVKYNKGDALALSNVIAVERERRKAQILPKLAPVVDTENEKAKVPAGTK